MKISRIIDQFFFEKIIAAKTCEKSHSYLLRFCQYKYKKDLFKIFILLSFLLASNSCNRFLSYTHIDSYQTETAQHYIYHTIKYSGETLGLISRWYTGSSDNWKKIQSANSNLNINAMKIGQTIRIPKNLVVNERSMPKSALPRSNFDLDRTESLEINNRPNNQTELNANVPDEVILQKVDEILNQGDSEEELEILDRLENSSSGNEFKLKNTPEDTKTREELLKELLKD